MHRVVKVLQTASVYDLATVEQANYYLQLESSTANDAQVQNEITSASRIIATQCDRVFGSQEVLETFVFHSGECIDSLNLDRPPVMDLISVVDNGQTLTTDDYDLDEHAGIIWRRHQWLHWWGGWFGPNRGRIEVTYTGGYDLPDGAPPDLTRACVELMREFRLQSKRPDSSIRMVQHGDTQVMYQQGTFAIAGQAALPPHVMDLLKPFMIPAFA